MGVWTVYEQIKSNVFVSVLETLTLSQLSLLLQKTKFNWSKNRVAWFSDNDGGRSLGGIYSRFWEIILRMKLLHGLFFNWLLCWFCNLLQIWFLVKCYTKPTILIFGTLEHTIQIVLHFSKTRHYVCRITLVDKTKFTYVSTISLTLKF